MSDEIDSELLTEKIFARGPPYFVFWGRLDLESLEDYWYTTRELYAFLLFPISSVSG